MKPHHHLNVSPAEFWTMAFQQSTRTNPRQGDDGAEEAFWQDYAPQYDVRSPLARLAVALVRDVISLLQADDVLLEIGPGSGAFTRYLAPHVKGVVGVEPSAAMRDIFCKFWPRSTLPVPELIPGKWEDCPERRADVVFVANALYRVSAIELALKKMTKSASRHVIIVQTVGRPHAGPLVVSSHQGEFERERADALCDVLDDMGVHFRRRTYPVDRGDEDPCDVALIDWRT